MRFDISKESRPGRVRFGAVVGLLGIALGAGGCASGPTVATTNPPATTPQTPTPSGSVQLTIRPSGTGTGTVTADPPGPNYQPGTSVTLTAIPGSTSLLTGWTAPCPTTLPPATTCRLTLTSSVTVTVQFDLD